MIKLKSSEARLSDKWCKLFVLLIFLSATFVFTLYDGYRQIYMTANIFQGAEPQRPYAEHVENGRIAYYRGLQQEVEFLNNHSTMRETKEPLDERHKLRWFYKNIEASVYDVFAERISLRAALYVHYLHYALWMTIAFVFVAATVTKLRGEMSAETLGLIGFILFALIAFVGTMPRMVDLHSIIEMATMAGAVYFALERRLLLFMFVSLVAVSNRETGLAIGIVYLLLNWGERRAWLSLFSSPIFFLIINFRLLILPEFYNLENFVVRGGMGYINLFNLGDVALSLIAFTLIKMFVLLAPLSFILKRVKIDPVSKKLLLLFGFYLVVLILGTILGNLFPYAMLFPYLFALAARAFPAPASTDIEVRNQRV